MGDHSVNGIVVTDEDFEVEGRLVRQVHLVGDPGDPALTVTLNSNALVGDTIKILACDVPGHVVDEDGTTVSDVPVGTGQEFVFCPSNEPADDCECGSGHWIPICCAGATGATGVTGPTGPTVFPG